MLEGISKPSSTKQMGKYNFAKIVPFKLLLERLKDQFHQYLLRVSRDMFVWARGTGGISQTQQGSSDFCQALCEGNEQFLVNRLISSPQYKA